jgi:hypothetical protein
MVVYSKRVNKVNYNISFDIKSSWPYYFKYQRYYCLDFGLRLVYIIFYCYFDLFNFIIT